MGLARSDESAKRLEAVRAAVQCDDLEDSPALQRRPRNLLALSILRFSTTSHGAATFPQWRRLIAVQWGRWELRLPARTGRSCSHRHGRPGSRPVRHRGRRTRRKCPDASRPCGLRAATATLALSLRGIGVRSCVLRLPPTATTVSPARLPSPSANVASQRTSVRERSAGRRCIARTFARLARLALESAPASSVLHAVAAAVVQLRHITEIMARHLGVPTPSASPVEALEHFGHLGHFIGLDSPGSAASTSAQIDWGPAGPNLFEDLEAEHCSQRSC